jgi:hypothetical protein
MGISPTIYNIKIYKKLNILSTSPPPPPPPSSLLLESEDAWAYQKYNFQFDGHSFVAVTGCLILTSNLNIKKKEKQTLSY